MIKKIIAMFATLSLFSVQASVPVNNFKEAVDELNYAITVDWDQQDMTFYNRAVDDFKRSIENLTDAGMTNDEIIKEVIASVKNEKQAAELQRMVGLLRSEQMTKEEVVNFIADKVRTTQDEGAHYEGGPGNIMGTLIVVGLLVGLSYYLIRIHTDNQDSTTDTGCGCGQGGNHQGGEGQGCGEGDHEDHDDYEYDRVSFAY